MKPILFNTEMARAILDGPKTVTRGVVRGINNSADFLTLIDSPSVIAVDKHGHEYPKDVKGLYANFVQDGDPEYPLVKAPYRTGDILYVRETWQKNPYGIGWPYFCKASPEEFDHSPDKWSPSIHMPREAARIFLRVTDVRVERLQDSFFKHGSTIFSLLIEGIDIGEQCRECIDAYGSPCCIDSESECGVLDEVRSEFADLWNRCYAAPRPVKGKDGVIIYYESYPWEGIQETRTYKGKPWYVIGNPWVWVIEFEKISKPV